MPGRDGTGPMGMGPLTGRGFGDCSNIFYPWLTRRRVDTGRIYRLRNISRLLIFIVWILPGIWGLIQYVTKKTKADQ